MPYVGVNTAEAGRVFLKENGEIVKAQTEEEIEEALDRLISKANRPAWKAKLALAHSPEAAKQLMDEIREGDISPFGDEADDLMGQTDCPDGCFVEPDGRCPHGYMSAGRSAGVI